MYDWIKTKLIKRVFSVYDPNEIEYYFQNEDTLIKVNIYKGLKYKEVKVYDFSKYSITNLASYRPIYYLNNQLIVLNQVDNIKYEFFVEPLSIKEGEDKTNKFFLKKETNNKKQYEKHISDKIEKVLNNDKIYSYREVLEKLLNKTIDTNKTLFNITEDGVVIYDSCNNNKVTEKFGKINVEINGKSNSESVCQIALEHYLSVCCTSFDNNEFLKNIYNTIKEHDETKNNKN